MERGHVEKGNSLTVVALDDDPDYLVLISALLEAIPDQEIRLNTFLRTDEFLDRLPELRPDVIFLDYVLEAETGLDVLRAMGDERKAIPVIMLTGLGDEQVAVECMKLGAADYMPKSSLSTSSLQRAINNAVEKWKLQADVENYKADLRETNESLLRKNREIQDFYHLVSHELKTPLTSARELVSIVLEGLAGEIDDEKRQYLDLAKESCDQIKRLLDDLLDAARMETGKLVIQPASMRLDAVVERAVRASRPLADSRKLALDFAGEEDLPETEIDGARIQQVIGNLISNSVKFTPAGGSILVRVARDREAEEELEVTVTDSGRGIPAEHLDRIFERLHQVRRQDCGREGGLGIGLSLCQEIVERHGGRIEVQSTVGEGSTFRFTLPVVSKTLPVHSVMKETLV